MSIAQTASLKLAKSFNLDGNSKITLMLPGDAEITVWDKPHVNVAIRIEVANLNQNIADELARVGRYDLSASSDGGSLNISSPNSYKKVRIRGQEIKEQMTYRVFLPRDTEVEILPKEIDALAIGGK